MLIVSKNLLMTLGRPYCNVDERSPAFFKAGLTLDTFHRFGNDFSFRQRLNNVGNNSELMFLRTSEITQANFDAMHDIRMIV